MHYKGDVYSQNKETLLSGSWHASCRNKQGEVVTTLSIANRFAISLLFTYVGPL